MPLLVPSTVSTISWVSSSAVSAEIASPSSSGSVCLSVSSSGDWIESTM